MKRLPYKDVQYICTFIYNCISTDKIKTPNLKATVYILYTGLLENIISEKRKKCFCPFFQMTVGKMALKFNFVLIIYSFPVVIFFNDFSDIFFSITAEVTLINFRILILWAGFCVS